MIKVEIQNLDRLTQPGPSDPEREARLEAAERDLAERENAFEARKAVLESDLELREEEVERREDLLAVREEGLAERQRELGVYVSQIQGRIESPWAGPSPSLH